MRAFDAKGAAVSLLTGVRTLAPSLTTLAVMVLIWAAAVDALQIPKYLIPSPASVLEVFTTQTELLWENSLRTAYEVVVGFIVAVVLGIPLGMAIAESRLFGRIVYPLIIASQSIPKIAIGPLLVVWFGFGLTPKLIMVVLVAFFPIVVNTAIGMKSVSPSTISLARSIGLSKLATFTKIRLPQAMPNIFGGLEVAITFAVIGAVVGEFLGADLGLGYLLVAAGGQLETAMLFAALVAVTILGLVMYGFILAIKRLTIPWAFEEPTAELA